MKEGLTEIVCIIDKSGSMHDKVDDVIGGFNDFLAEQKALPGEALLSVTLFDSAIVTPVEGARLADVAPWERRDYRPRGHTALLDAVGVTLDAVGERLDRMPEPERPEKVVVCIITDGQENASRRYERGEILEKITRRREVCGWEFVFLGADLESFREARALGIRAAHRYAKTPEGIKGALKGMSDAVSMTRRGRKAEDYDGKDLLF